MSTDPVLDRRTVLVTGLAGAGALTLAACGSSSGGDTNGSEKAAQSASTSAASSAQSSQSSSEDSSSAASDSSSAASGGSSAAAAGGTELAKLSDIKVGEAISAKLDGKPIIVSRPTETTAACFSAICTHQGCTVKPAGKELDCPCHGSSFNATTGAVLGGPAPSPLPKVNVTVKNGSVFAG